MKNVFKATSWVIIFMTIIMISCKNTEKTDGDIKGDNKETVQESKGEEVKISLAQWSLNGRYNADDGNPFNFAQDAKNLGFDAIEYVSQLYSKEIEELGFDIVIDSLRKISTSLGVKNVLIMIDGEGDLADPDEAVRNEAVENHKKWVDAAAKFGCHSVRVNTSGTNDPAEYLASAQDGLRKLATYAATKNINVIVENHGGLSSDAPKLVEVINAVNLPNCGTLPDFGNWCITRGEKGCAVEYPDMYDGLERLMTVAKAVSAKSNDFDEEGNETKKDYVRMLQIVKDAGYTGYIGVEYEGRKLSEEDGIIATKKLIEKASAQLK